MVLRMMTIAGVSHAEDGAVSGIEKQSSFAFDAISAFRTSAHPIPSRGGFLLYLGGIQHHDLGINSPSLMSASNLSSQSWRNLLFLNIFPVPKPRSVAKPPYCSPTFREQEWIVNDIAV
jgi:hypothetical protein